MNRREFSKLIGVGTLAASAAGGLPAYARDTGKRSAKKDWAKSHFQGFENILMPSFSPDFKRIDEAGIRHDVRQSIKHGVFSVFCPGVGLDLEEKEAMIRLVSDEAGGKIATGTSLGPKGTLQQRKQHLQMIEKAGCTHVLIHPPHDFHADSEDELYRYYRELVDATDLAVVLWATDGKQFANLHSSNVVLPVYDKLANEENVVAVKLMTTLDLPTVFAVSERLYDRLLVGGVHLGIMPMLVAHYDMQWSGAWAIETLQSPEKPFVSDFLTRLRQGNIDQAMKIYYHIKPAYNAVFELMAPMLPKGVHPFTHLKYYQWAVGGNGGLLREPRDPVEREFPLRPEDREKIRSAFRRIGIEPRSDEASFIVGTANHRKGVSVSDLAKQPMYAS